MSQLRLCATTPECRDSDHAGRPYVLRTPVELRGLVWREWERALRSGREFSLVFVDVIEEAGEKRKSWEALTQVLILRLRSSDEAGWVNRKRLCVVLPSTTIEGAGIFVEHVRRSMAERNIPITTSVRCLSPARESTHRFYDESPDMGLEDFTPREPAWKRPVDTVGAALAILLAAPVMVLVALAVKLTSPGPVLFKQRRIGYKARPFNMYKFRSMATGVSDRLHQEYVQKFINGNAGKNREGCFKLTDDPRLTPVGRFIREWSLDELPQLFNVLVGDMSLVGPRPDPWYAKKDYLPWYYDRVLRVKPGITGLWQVEGRSRVSYENMVRMDIRYFKCLSFLNDLRIFLRTFRAVLTRSGAH